MKIVSKLLLAFYLPIHFAVGAFYLSAKILGDKVICGECIIYISKCADNQTEMLSIFFNISGIGLIILGVFLPILIFSRERKKKSVKSLGLK